MCLQVDGRGGYVNFADQTNFPVSTTMLGALVKFGPGGLRQLHWHPTLDEWQFVINGTFEVRPCQEIIQSCRLAGCTGMPGWANSTIACVCFLHVSVSASRRYFRCSV